MIATASAARAVERDWTTAAVVCALGVISVVILNGDPRAAFPPGDGGLFAQICTQIIDGGFAFPRTIGYNGLAIPFSYSPLAFYGVALLARALHAEIPRAMQWWVIGWTFAFAPAAYYAARQILGDRAQALVACGVLVVLPVNAAWLGMGGGVTRAPGFVLYIVACGAAWAALRDGGRARIVLAVAAGGAIAWLHMEFFFLYAVTLVIFAGAFVRRIPVLVAIGGGAALLAVPWVLISHHDAGALQNALRTRHFAKTSVPFVSYMRYVGIGAPGDWVGLTAIASILVLAVRRNVVYVAWAVLPMLLDSRAGVQIAHLPAALATGAVFGLLQSRFPRPHDRRAALAVALAAIAITGIDLVPVASRYVRMEPSDVALWRWMDAHLEGDAAVFTLSPRSLAEPALDQTFEWLPVYAKRVSPLTYQGREWVHAESFQSRAAAFFAFQEECVRRGPPCAEASARALAPGVPQYVYVPRHGEDYGLVTASFRTAPRVRLVHEEAAGAVFRLP